MSAEAGEGAFEAFGGGGFGDVQQGGDFGVGFVFVETEEEHLAVGEREAVKGGFEVGFDLLPLGSGGLGGGHGGGLRFVAGAASVGAKDIGGDVFGDLVEPGA